MYLTEYLSGLTRTLEEYSQTGFVTFSEIGIDSRTEKIGLMRGSVVFLDESKLFFTEYLDLRYKVEKISYSFHYQDKDGNLIFRYDNARHRPDVPFRDHKHVAGGGIFQSEIPEFKAVLEEIIGMLAYGR